MASTTQHPAGDALGAFMAAHSRSRVLDDDSLLSMRNDLTHEESQIRGAKNEITHRKMAVRMRKMELAEAERELKKLETSAGASEDEIKAWTARFGLADRAAEGGNALDGMRQVLQSLQDELVDEDVALRQRKAEVLSQENAFRFRRSVLAEVQDDMSTLASLAQGKTASADLSESELARLKSAVAKLQPLQEALMASQEDIEQKKEKMSFLTRPSSGLSLKTSASWASFASTEEDQNSADGRRSSAPESPSSAVAPSALVLKTHYSVFEDQTVLMVAVWLCFMAYFMVF